MAVEVVQGDVGGLVDGGQAGGAARVHQIARQLGLAVDHHALAAGQAAHVDAVALAPPEHFEAAVDQALAMHARTDADLVEEVDAHLLEDAGADAAEHVVAGLPFEDHGVDAGLGQELAEQQPRRAGADDRDLVRVSTRRQAGSMPGAAWRRRRGRREELEQRAGRVGLAARARRPPPKSRDDLDGRRQGADHVDPVEVHQLGGCWKPSSTSPRATSVPTGTPGGG